MMLAKALGFWIFVFMVYHLNPLNDASNPESPYHEGSPERIKERKLLRQACIEEDDVELDGFRVIDWADVAPYFYPTLFTIIYLIVDAIFY